MNKELKIEEIRKKQPTLNIGMLGSVADGKSTLVYKLSGKKTQQHSSELTFNKTIKLGYANVKIFKCEECPKPQCYQTGSSNIKKLDCGICGKEMLLVRHLSFVDSPGHSSLIKTMLNGTAIMDAAILVVAAADDIPKLQTEEHLAAGNIVGFNDVVVCLNKIDQYPMNKTEEMYPIIREFLKGSCAESSQIIPTSAIRDVNIDVLLQHIVENVKENCDSENYIEEHLDTPAEMIVIRSFDVNKKNTEVTKLKGGVAGGSLIKGIFKKEQIVEIRPGLVMKNQSGEFSYRPIKTKITSLFSENNQLDIAIPGGLIGVGTQLDPSLTKDDRLVGHLIGIPGKLPSVYDALQIEFDIINIRQNSQLNLAKGEMILLNVNANNINCKIIRSSKSKPVIVVELLSTPVCCDILTKVTINKNIGGGWRIYGYGKIIKGKEITQS